MGNIVKSCINAVRRFYLENFVLQYEERLIISTKRALDKAEVAHANMLKSKHHTAEDLALIAEMSDIIDSTRPLLVKMIASSVSTMDSRYCLPSKDTKN